MILNLHSHFSLRYGTYDLEELVQTAKEKGYEKVVLADINNTSAGLSFIALCKSYGIEGVLGISFKEKGHTRYLGIAKNKEGFKELNDFLSFYNQTKQAFPKRAPAFKHAFVVYPYSRKQDLKLRENERIGISLDDVNRIALDADFSNYVIWHKVSFKTEDYDLHCKLRAIEFNLLLGQLKAYQLASKNEVFISKKELLNHFKAYPQIIRNTEKLLEACSFDFNFNKSRNKQHFTGNAYDDKQLLIKYALAGFNKRYAPDNQEAKKRLLHEIEVIHDLHFSGYFLITDDICRYARSRDFHYVGRGSGANSIVAYCLGITQVCPMKLNLYFERFLNPKRRNPPDFDIDFSWRDRDEIFDYIFTRYQSKNTALMGAISHFKTRSSIRELGKIYGLPKSEIDSLLAYPEQTIRGNDLALQIWKDMERMLGLPNQRTIHASGVLISEKPLTYYSALDHPPKNLPVVQYDMHVAEAIGFEKFDILSQRGLGHIRDCQELILKNKKEEVDLSDIDKILEDKQIAEQLKVGNTLGCFYIESPAMRQLLRKLKCDNYLSLVAASSIIRPGVASSGMMHTYIERHNNPEKVVYLNPIFEEHLKETFGVMVYQEDVLKIGHHFGGLDLAEADVLRRMMSGKTRSKKHLTEIADKYWANCRAKGYDDELIAEVWRQMESFAGYSFNKAHSASFAVESYQSLYLKTYYPIEFIVSVLNNYGGYYSREIYINEAKLAGAKIALPCVNHSQYQAILEDEKLYLGFDCLLHMEERLAYNIAVERKRNGAYKDLEDFIQRIKAGLEQVQILIRVGAFRFLGINKKNLLWKAHLLSQQKTSQNMELFENTLEIPKLPNLESSFIEELYDEIELLGFPVSGTWFDLSKSDYKGNVNAMNLVEREGEIVRFVGYLATWKNVRTKNQQLMKFGTFLDQYGQTIETVHFPQNLKQYPLHGRALYLVEGKCVVDFGFPSVEVHKCGKMLRKEKV